MNEVIGIIITFLLGLGALGAFWGKVSKVLKAVKEILDVPYSVGNVSRLIDEGLADKTLTEDEVNAIEAAIKDVKTQFEEAKAAIGDLTFLKMKVSK